MAKLTPPDWKPPYPAYVSDVEDALTMALIPMGYPSRGRWAEPRRRPVEEVVHWGRWGDKRPRTD